MLQSGWLEETTQKATDTMNSQEFRQAARTTFALAMDAYYAVSNNNDATMEQLIAADVAKTAADAQWIADQHTANTMAQAELDAATAKGCEEVVEVVSKDFATMTAAEAAYTTAAADYAACNINPTTPHEVFGIAWGADGEVLTYEQTIEAIATRKGWYDWQGHWVNMAAQEKRLSMRLTAAEVAATPITK